jgi:hypothetical protein
MAGSITPQTPEQLLADFDAGSQGVSDVDMRSVLWAIIADVKDSYRRAMSGISPDAAEAIQSEVDDYLAAHYGD